MTIESRYALIPACIMHIEGAGTLEVRTKTRGGKILTIESRYALIAACIMHIEGAFSVNSLAYKNNNPGNLRAVGSSVGFNQYPTKQAGFDALVADVAANAGKTLESFVAKYAPPNENNSVLYLHLVSELTGIQPTEVI